MKNYIKKGYYVDIRNTQGYWCAGIVLENDEENVKVRFDGYGVKTDTVCNSLLHLLIKITIETQNKFLSPCSFSSIYRGYLRLTLFFIIIFSGRKATQAGSEVGEKKPTTIWVQYKL